MNTLATDNDIVAAVICAEARGENHIGMEAVAEVIHNRVIKSGWKSTPSQVVRKRAQFCGYDKDEIGLVAWMKKTPQWDWCWELSRSVHSRCLLRETNKGIVGGATHFANVSVCGIPKWAKGVKPSIVIGQHMFWKL